MGGHLDVNNGGVGKVGGIICPTDDEPKDVYQEHIASLVDAFLSVVFEGDASAETMLNDVSTMKVDAEAQNDYNGHSAPFSPCFLVQSGRRFVMTCHLLTSTLGSQKLF